ncbi:MAG: aldehyde dehydrogenase family protein [Myxococcota bacterium]|nr:aldehyde dehydrogenase family protein [Myxococcota bacterium]
MTITNPSTGGVIRTLNATSTAEVEEAVRRARQAQPNWAERPISERKAVIQNFKERLIHRLDALALTLCTETGKPISQARGEINATPGRIDYFLDNVDRVSAPRHVLMEPTHGRVVGTGDLEEIVSYDPLGVIANISAWNYPYFVGTNVFIPALLTGNSVVYKPSEYATLTGFAIRDMLRESGVPEGVFELVVGDGKAGQALLNSDIDGVFFTGSYGTGVKIATAVAHRLIRTQLELGGKDPVYVADDVDPRTAAQNLVEGAFYNNGQSCCAVERIYVHHDIYRTFLSTFVEATRGLEMGPPDKEATFLGPLTRQAQIDVLNDQISDAVQKGATVLCGGEAITGDGWYFSPTVLSNVNHTMKVMTEETFGPVIGIQSVTSDQEAAELMRDTPYGLTASVYSQDRHRAVSILSQVPSGTSYWNCCDRVSPRLPWTGRGASGLGSTLSDEGIRAFLECRGWHLRAAK